MPELHYRDRFLIEQMGGKLLALAKRVHGAGVVLTANGTKLDADKVSNLSKGTHVLAEEDVRTFVRSVSELGGYEGNANLTAITDFLRELEGSSTMDNSSEPPDRTVTSAPVETAPAQGGGHTALLERPAQEPVVEMQQPKVAPAQERAALEAPPREYPRVPGLCLQEDGFYWKKE